MSSELPDGAESRDTAPLSQGPYPSPAYHRSVEPHERAQRQNDSGTPERYDLRRFGVWPAPSSVHIDRARRARRRRRVWLAVLVGLVPLVIALCALRCARLARGANGAPAGAAPAVEPHQEPEPRRSSSSPSCLAIEPAPCPIAGPASSAPTVRASTEAPAHCEPRPSTPRAAPSVRGKRTGDVVDPWER